MRSMTCISKIPSLQLASRRRTWTPRTAIGLFRMSSQVPLLFLGTMNKTCREQLCQIIFSTFQNWISWLWPLGNYIYKWAPSLRTKGAINVKETLRISEFLKCEGPECHWYGSPHVVTRSVAVTTASEGASFFSRANPYLQSHSYVALAWSRVHGGTHAKDTHSDIVYHSLSEIASTTCG